MAVDVADIVVVSATFLYVFESEEENDEKDRCRRIRRRPRCLWVHNVNHLREVC